MGLRIGQAGRAIPEPESGGATCPNFRILRLGPLPDTFTQAVGVGWVLFAESAAGMPPIGATVASRENGQGFTLESPSSRRYAGGAAGEQAAEAKTHGQWIQDGKEKHMWKKKSGSLWVHLPQLYCLALSLRRRFCERVRTGEQLFPGTTGPNFFYRQTSRHSRTLRLGRGRAPRDAEHPEGNSPRNYGVGRKFRAATEIGPVAFDGV